MAIPISARIVVQAVRVAKALQSSPEAHDHLLLLKIGRYIEEPPARVIDELRPTTRKRKAGPANRRKCWRNAEKKRERKREAAREETRYKRRHGKRRKLRYENGGLTSEE